MASSRNSLIVVDPDHRWGRVGVRPSQNSLRPKDSETTSACLTQTMVTKLKFKGEKQKKRKRTHDDTKRQLNSEDTAQDGWVAAESLEDISTGPLFITFASSPPVALASDPLGKIYASHITLNANGEIANAEPDDVRQVWIATRVVGSKKISLKTATGKLLSCDRVGILSATKEAIGPQEEWEPVQRDNAWAFRNVFERFLYIYHLFQANQT